MTPDLSDRYAGSLLGLACGDAVGTSVEFCPRGTFSPLVDMVGGGPFNLVPGQWTDDTSMALCLAESLLTKNGFDAKDQMGRYLNWWQWGYMSSTGECFDIGNTVRQALLKYQQTNQPFAGPIEPDTAGNGSLMRLAPVVLFYYPSHPEIAKFTAASSCTTHSAPEAIECCQLLGELIAKALSGKSKAEILGSSQTILAKIRFAASRLESTCSRRVNRLLARVIAWPRWKRRYGVFGARKASNRPSWKLPTLAMMLTPLQR